MNFVKDAKEFEFAGKGVATGYKGHRRSCWSIC